MLYIDGSWVPAASGATFESRNPATGEVLGEVADGGAEDAAAGVRAAQGAFRAWRIRRRTSGRRTSTTHGGS